MLGSENTERVFVSSPSIFQMFDNFMDIESPLVCRERDVAEVREGDTEASSYSSNDKSAEDVEDGDRLGD